MISRPIFKKKSLGQPALSSTPPLRFIHSLRRLPDDLTLPLFGCVRVDRGVLVSGTSPSCLLCIIQHSRLRVPTGLVRASNTHCWYHLSSRGRKAAKGLYQDDRWHRYLLVKLGVDVNLACSGLVLFWSTVRPDHLSPSRSLPERPVLGLSDDEGLTARGPPIMKSQPLIRVLVVVVYFRGSNVKINISTKQADEDLQTLISIPKRLRCRSPCCAW